MNDSTRGGFIRFVGGVLHNRHVDIDVWKHELTFKVRDRSPATLYIGNVKVADPIQVWAHVTYQLRPGMSGPVRFFEYVHRVDYFDLFPPKGPGTFAEGLPPDVESMT